MKKIFLVILIIFIIIISNNYKNNSLIILTQTGSLWKNIDNDPVIKYGDVIEWMLWWDSSVIKDWDTYKMWLSGWKPFETPLVVKIYYASSKDWINWNIKKEPVFESEKDSWDSSSVETPSVIKVWNTYHMYYTWYDWDFKTGIYSIWHAISSDWIIWKRDSNNPVVVPHDDPLKWWHYTAAEPWITYYNNKFYLYYASAKSNYPSWPWSWFWIMVATSNDWSNFSNNKIAYSITSSYDKTKYRWYSTPAVYIENDTFYLYHNIVYNLDWFEQIGIWSATSKNWFNFNESEVEIVWKTTTWWKSESVLAPTVIWDNWVEKMWFSWHQFKPDYNFWIWYIYKEKK